MKPLRTPHSALRTPHFALRTLLTLAALICAFSAAALPLGLRLAARRAAVEAQSQAETPEERAYRIYAPGSAFEVTVTNGATVAFWLRPLPGRTITVDWGDGATSEHTENSSISHVYAADGKFVVKISDDAYYFAFYNWSGRFFVTAALRWGDNINSCYYSYGECLKLTGFVPRWNDKISNANLTYSKCSGLTGDIPKWGAAMTSTPNCYLRCSGLTGAWTDDPDELMPARITSHGWCVSYCSAALRALFYSDWGGTREKPADE